MSALVQIALYPGGLGYMQEVLSSKRPVELEELIAALSRMFGRIGMHAICAKCFAGEKLPQRKIPRSGPHYDKKWQWVKSGKYTRLAVHLSRRRGLGCCGSCEMLGHSACIKKPLGCAQFFCGYTGDIFWQTREFVDSMRSALADAGIHGGCYGGAVVGEGKRKYSMEMLKMLRILRHAVDAWEAA